MSVLKIPILDLSPQYQSLKTEIYSAIDRVLESGQFIMGPDVKQFEQEVAAYLGVKHAIAVNSGTDALVIGLRSLGIGAGDEVITTPFSFFATAESISSVGATPIFVDIDPQTFNIDPANIKDKITLRTRAIMPVHLYGNPAAMTQIMEIDQENGLKIIEDCAQSFGARYNGKMTGSIGDVGAYSFFPSKNLGAYGDGGLIATNDDAIANLSRMLRVHGAKKKYHNEIIGYNSRLDTLQAAILRVKLPHIDQWNAGRRRVSSLYTQLLADIPEVIAPEVNAGHVFHQYTIRIIKSDRDKVASNLASKGISTMIYYPIPQDRLPIYAGKYPSNKVSDELGTQVLSLPIWPELDDENIKRVVSSLKVCVVQ
jgi:dTDP-4-amino-4,6-dideoxygalactose transaminase